MNLKNELKYNLFTCSSAQRAAKIGSRDAIVQKVNAEVANAHALLLDMSVTQMFVKIAGLSN